MLEFEEAGEGRQEMRKCGAFAWRKVINVKVRQGGISGGNKIERSGVELEEPHRG